MVQSNGLNRYFASLTPPNLVDWQFDHVHNWLYFSNASTVFNATLNISYNPSTGATSNITFNVTAQFQSLQITSFQLIGTYLVISCYSCNSNTGKIQIYNYNLPLPSINTTNTKTKPVVPPNNMTLIFEQNSTYNSSQYFIGEKTFLDVISVNMMRLIYTARSSGSSTAPRNLLQVEMLYNNSGYVFKNTTLLTGISPYTYPSINYNSGFLLMIDNQTYLNTSNNKTSWNMIANFS